MSGADSSSPGHLPTTFRRLQRNDIEQTNDQWKENLLKETGATAPLWTAYARSNQNPVVDLARPRAPLKPSDPEIMAEMKLAYRTAISVNRKVPLADVPVCSSSVI